MNPHSVFPQPLSPFRVLLCAALLLAGAAAPCQSARSIAPPLDTAYPGEMLLEVDLRDPAPSGLCRGMRWVSLVLVLQLLLLLAYVPRHG